MVLLNPFNFPNRTMVLTDEDRQEATDSLRHFLQAEFDMDVGALAAGTLLDHVVRDLGPSIYNQAVRDVQERLHAQISALDLDMGETEFPVTRRLKRS